VKHRVAIARLLAAVSIAFTVPSAARAQQAAAPDEHAPTGSSFSLMMLRDLPSSNNLFSLLEGVEPNVITDRFYGGGLNTGHTARIGAFLNSWTQTQYRVGDVNITAPDGSGSPFLFPALPLWERVDVAAGVMPIGFGAPGLGVSFEPMRPSGRWTGAAEASFAGSGLVASPPRARRRRHRDADELGPRRISGERTPLHPGWAW
jgi:hypothetical protein